MKQPKIEIILNKHWGNSHVLIDGQELPAFAIEIERLDGDHQLVMAKITVMPDMLKIDPELVKFIESEIKDPDRPLDQRCVICRKSVVYTYAGYSLCGDHFERLRIQSNEFSPREIIKYMQEEFFKNGK